MSFLLFDDHDFSKMDVYELVYVMADEVIKNAEFYEIEIEDITLEFVSELLDSWLVSDS